jgi:hypothetical protein
MSRDVGQDHRFSERQGLHRALLLGGGLAASVALTGTASPEKTRWRW